MCLEGLRSAIVLPRGRIEAAEQSAVSSQQSAVKLYKRAVVLPIHPLPAQPRTALSASPPLRLRLLRLSPPAP